MRRKCWIWQLIHPPPLHVETIMAKPHPSVGKEDPLSNKVIPKDPR